VTTPSTFLVMASIAFGAVALAGCADGVPTTDAGTHCVVTANAAWIYDQDSIDATLPKCPIRIGKGHADTVVTFTATLLSPPEDEEPSYVIFHVVDAHGHGVTDLLPTAFWSQQTDRTWIINVTGSYYAGNVGQLTDTTKQVDTATVTFTTGYSDYLDGSPVASVQLPYSFTMRVKATAPSLADDTTRITVSGTYDNNNDPVTSAWYLNGVEVGALANASTFTYVAGAMGNVTFKVVFTDADGDIGSDSATTFFTSTDAPGGGGWWRRWDWLRRVRSYSDARRSHLTSAVNFSSPTASH
jgi:hypothetical protein